MRKFKVKVETVKEYEIEVDDSIATDEELENWESVFWSLDCEEDRLTSYVASYAELRAAQGMTFIEGFRVVAPKGKIPFGYKEDDLSNHMFIIKADDNGDSIVTIKEIEQCEVVDMTSKYIGSSNSNYKHGLKNTRLFSIWSNMKTRCYNSNSLQFKSYGARGIKICTEWLNDFKKFYD